MANDLRWLATPFRESTWGEVACPTCMSGRLAVTKLASQWDAPSERARSHEDWDPDWVTGTFTGWLQCNRTQCGEPVAVAGEMRIGYDHDADSHSRYDDYYTLRFAFPALPLTGILPAETPAIVKQRLAEASAVLWTDPNAAAGRIRLAVEDLLTALRVPRYNYRPRKMITLHARIERLKATRPDAARTLEAVKWIGNQGSHEDSLTVDDVLDGVDIFVYALQQIYDAEVRALQRKIAEVNTNKRIGSRSVRAK